MGQVIQGYFVGGSFRQPGVLLRRASATARHATEAPPPALGGRAGEAGDVALQRRTAPGRPAPVHAAGVVQARGANDSFAIDPVQVGLARGGGQPLPPAVLAKMEAAFATDFSGVRVHIGPQASRIGAIAFTTGTDLYFAPGQYQPDSVKGQQLIGHELAHVVQQRQGRVRAPGNGVSVVQDHALEAEADRLGMRAAAHRMPVQRQQAPGAIQRAVAVSAPEPAGPGRFRLTARDQGRSVGSVMVDVQSRSGAFVTDLGVDPGHRDRGIGKMLVAHAARTGMRFGKTSVELAADDKGSGRLTRWYKDMGFAPTGVNERRQQTMRAASARLGALQPKAAASVTWSRVAPPADRGLRDPVVQRSSASPAYHRRPSLDASDDKQMKEAQKHCLKSLDAAYNLLTTAVNDYKAKGTDDYAQKNIPGYVTGASNSGNGAPASWFSKFVEEMNSPNTHKQLATKFGTAVCELMYYYLNGNTSMMMGNIAIESPKPVLLPSGDLLSVDYSKIGTTSGSRPDVRVVLPSKGEGVIDVTSSTAKANHTSNRNWAKDPDCRYIAEITYPGMTNKDLTDPAFRF